MNLLDLEVNGVVSPISDRQLSEFENAKSHSIDVLVVNDDLSVDFNPKLQLRMINHLKKYSGKSLSTIDLKAIQDEVNLIILEWIEDHS